MNIVSAFCLSLFFATTLGAETPKLCVKKDSNKCEEAKTQGLNVTCHEIPKEDSCVSEVASGKADLAYAVADELVKNVDEVKIVLAENYGLNDSFVKYYGVAVVKMDKAFTFQDLKGKKSCHTGAGKTAGWKIPVGYLLYSKQMPFIDNQWKSVAEFFNGSCVPGIKNKTEDKNVQDKLCMQCNSTCKTDEPYSDYMGAFRCMDEGRGDVAFVKQSTPEDTLGQGADLSGYRLLCRNGTNKEIKDYASCHIGKRPSGAIVTGTRKDKAMIAAYRQVIKAVNITVLMDNEIISRGVKDLEPTNSTTKDYVGKYYDYLMALSRAKSTSTTPTSTTPTSTTPTSTTPTSTTPTSTTANSRTPTSGSSSAAGFFVLHVFSFLSYFCMF